MSINFSIDNYLTMSNQTNAVFLFEKHNNVSPLCCHPSLAEYVDKFPDKINPQFIKNIFSDAGFMI